jgi:hypothetical protein
MAWLGRTTWFQRIALILLLAAGAWSAIARVVNRDSSAGSFLFAALLTFAAFRGQILWRVRNRLLLTFFLFGIVPLFLISTMLYLSAMLLLGQLASDRVTHDLDARIATLQGALLVKYATAPLDQIIPIVTKAVDEWSPDPDARDDTTIVLLRRR